MHTLASVLLSGIVLGLDVEVIAVVAGMRYLGGLNRLGLRLYFDWCRIRLGFDCGWGWCCGLIRLAVVAMRALAELST